MSDTIDFTDFLKVDLRAGTVVDAQPYPEARKPAIKIWVDFGEEIGVKQTSAQVSDYYSPEALVGMRVAGVVNFPAKQIGKFMSEVLVVGFDDGGGIRLIHPHVDVPNGARLH